jgi:uncharacterized protein
MKGSPGGRGHLCDPGITPGRGREGVAFGTKYPYESVVKILVTGGTGFIGRHLAGALLARGDSVRLPTRSPRSAEVPEGAEVVAWDPDASDWYDMVDGQDAVVHLAGEPVVGVRWTDSVKAEVEASRVRSTERLVEAMWRAKERPKVFISGSGVGYYGHRGDAPLDEQSEGGGDFLALVCKHWEAAAQKAEDLGIRVVRTRFGVVFGRGGGALSEMVKPFKAFVGGPIGSGRQVVSWVHMEDVVGILVRALGDPALQGAINVTAPSPVTNGELSRALGEVLGRPSFVRVPEFALRLRFGEGADPLLTGQRALPKVMQDAGYVWVYPEARAALVEALGR